MAASIPYSKYRLEMTNGLPPGTDTAEQLDLNPRLARPPPVPRRQVPEWPPVEARKGKWIGPYLDTLDAETEFDQIAKTNIFFTANDFGIALGYAAIFCMLTRTPAGATAVNHGKGKILTRGHQRYYDTQLQELQWLHYGSNAPETLEWINKVNKMHARVMKVVPGAYMFPWDAQMAIVSISYFETYVRKVAGAKRIQPHPQIQKAMPLWGEQICSHFDAEPGATHKNFGNNYPRSWEELERFFYWHQDFDLYAQGTEESIAKGRETAEHFINQFCELWFPRPLYWVGRSFLLTFTPPGVRKHQQTGEPNFLVAAFAKLFFKTVFDLSDAMNDPVEPDMNKFREDLLAQDTRKIDAKTKADRKRQDRILIGCIVALSTLLFVHMCKIMLPSLMAIY